MSGLLLPGAVSAASTTSSGSAPLRPSRSGALCRQPLGLQLAAAPPARRLASSPRTADCARWRRVQQQHKLATAAAADADAAALAAAAAEPEQQQQQQAQAQPHAADPAAADPAAAAAMGSSADGAAVEAAPKKKSGSLAKRVVFGVILGLSGAAVIIIGGWVYAGVACLAAFQLSQVRRLRSRGMAAAGMAALPQCRCQQKLLALMLWRTALRRRCRAQVLCFLVNWRPPLPCLNHPFINRSTLVW